jgi:hypothetical protein
MSVNTEELLESVRSLPNDQLQEFADQVLRLSASRRSRPLSTLESESLKAIHRPLPVDFIASYRALIGKRDAGTLAPDEHRELCALSDWLEDCNAERLGHVADLARSRGIGLSEMMAQLGLEHLVDS